MYKESMLESTRQISAINLNTMTQPLFLVYTI